MSTHSNTYFKLNCLEPQNIKKLLIVSNVIIAILGIIHWGYCIILGQFLALYYRYLTDQGSTADFIITYNQYKKMIDSPMAYTAITGIQQIITSVLIILVLTEYLGRTNKYVWIRVLTCLLLFNFAFNFVMAVNCSMWATYWNELFKDFFDQVNSMVNGYLHDWIVILIIMVKYVTAEAVLTFCVSLPLISLTAIALVENSFRQDIETQTQVSLQMTHVQIKGQDNK